MKEKPVVLAYSLAILLAGIVGSSTAYAQTPAEEVAPNMTTGAIAANTFIGHRVVTDQVIVGGHDMGKLLENLINLLGRKSNVVGGLGGATYTQAELQAVIDDAKVPPITIKKPELPKPVATPKPVDK